MDTGHHGRRQKALREKRPALSSVWLSQGAEEDATTKRPGVEKDPKG